MDKVLYAVIILNYNTIDDAVAAAESVKKAATTSDFVVCIADGASTKEQDRERCKNLSEKNIVTVCFDKNSGYATGNDQAIDFVREKYSPQYYVIMNPDVLILNKSTIEKMIARIEESGENVVGGQPLVWNCYYGDDARMQQNIRRVPDYADLCMLSNLFLKLICKKRYERFIYADKMPYQEEIRYQVPSGAFFVIRAEVFDRIGKFDENTFLYFEEHILGKKLENIGKELLFMPQFIVRHEHGKSTGNNRRKVNKFANKCGMQARNYYAKQYLKCSKAQMLLLDFLDFFNVPLQYLRVLVSRITNK